MEQHWVEGVLRWNPQTKRYGLFHDNHFANTGFFNGDKLEIFRGQAWVPTAVIKDAEGNWLLQGSTFTEVCADDCPARILKTTSPQGFDYLSLQKVKWMG